MLSLIPPTFGNRRPDAWNNVHVRYESWTGRSVIRDPGRYTGRHRREGS